MGLNIGKVASVASTIASHVDLGSLTGGINVSNLGSVNMDSVKSKIESALNGQVSSITSQLENSIIPSDITSMADQFNIENQVQNLQSSLNIDSPDLSQVDTMTNDMQSQIDSMMGSMNLSNINFM